MKELMQEIIGSAPCDLIDFFMNDNFINKIKEKINILNIKESYNFSKSINRISIANRLGLWALENSDNSNPFCYISKGPCKGSIIKFSHDPEPEIYYSNINDFVNNIEYLYNNDIDIEDAQKDSTLNFPLNIHIMELLKEDTEDSRYLVSLYIPICNDFVGEVKELLTNHSDYFIRESFAEYLCKSNDIEDIPFAEKLSTDLLSQVARPGKIARTKLNKIKYNG